MIRQSFSKKKIDSDLYVNKKTGESLRLENPNITSVNKVSNSFKVVSSMSYCIVDSISSKFIQQNFNFAEQGRIYTLSEFVKGELNILMSSSNKALTKKEIFELLDYSPNKGRDFLNKLEKFNVIAYTNIDKSRTSSIMFNPTFVRRQKSFSVECLNKFKDLSVS